MDKAREEDESTTSNNDRSKLPANINQESTSQPKRTFRNGMRRGTTQNGDPIYWVKTGELGISMSKANDDNVTNENPKSSSNPSPSVENHHPSFSIANGRESKVELAGAKTEEDLSDSKQVILRQNISRKKVTKVAKEEVSDYVQRRRHVIKWKDANVSDQDRLYNSFSQSFRHDQDKMTVDTVPELSQLMQDLASK